MRGLSREERAAIAEARRVALLRELWARHDREGREIA